jgi:hypothetical protein
VRRERDAGKESKGEVQHRIDTRHLYDFNITTKTHIQLGFSKTAYTSHARSDTQPHTPFVSAQNTYKDSGKKNTHITNAQKQHGLIDYRLLYSIYIEKWALARSSQSCIAWHSEGDIGQLGSFLLSHIIFTQSYLGGQRYWRRLAYRWPCCFLTL